MRDPTALVVGAGPAGLAAALALRRRGLDVLVIEAGDHGRAHDRTHAADTLRPEGRRLLATLGVPEAQFGCPRVEGRGILSAWDTSRIAEQTFFLQPFGPAWHVERPAFDRALAAAAEQAGITLWRSATLRGLARVQDVWRATVEVDDGTRPVEARYLIDATGRAARIARRLIAPRAGAARLTYDRLVALWATFEPARATGSMLLLEATAGGWWYSIPLPGSRLLAAYVTDGDLLPRGVAPAETWTTALTPARHTAARLRRRRRAGDFRPAIRAAGVGRLTQAAGPGWLAVGDAAATLDPLSGSGLTQALASGQRAAAAVAADAAGDDFALARYGEQTIQGFGDHLAERARHYGGVKRFAGHLFWRRRRPVDAASAPITLDPMSRPAAVTETAYAASVRLEGLLPKQDIARLRALCARPQEAHRIVARFKEVAATPIDDRTAIVALQVMTRQQPADGRRSADDAGG